MASLFVDHISSLKRGMILRKLKKTKKQMAQESRLDHASGLYGYARFFGSYP